jgi:peptidoglycan/LPS O-acetylase OafA/YrhL
MNTSRRIDYLDSVRGIAAMMVVFYHFNGWKWEHHIGFHLSSIIFNGSDAVSFFFVLSGFVLSYKYFKNAQTEIDIKEYVLKRFFRIYPAYIATVFLNYFYVNRHTLGLNTIKDIFYSNDQQLWQELFLVKSNHNFYIPGWTLSVEMAVSLLLPFIIIIARKNIHYIYSFILVSIFISAAHISMFTMHFCLGLLLAFYFDKIQAFQFQQHKLYPYRWLGLLIVLVLFSIRHIDRIHSIGHQLKNILLYWGIDFFHISGIASALIILFILNNKSIQTFLTIKPLLFIGKISYSIYLMHWLVIGYIMEHWDKWNSYYPNKYIVFAVMLTVAVSTTLLLATALYYFVEVPFIQLAKKIKISRRKMN